MSLIVLCGPTATGKTKLALELAERLGAEIISADSGQVYRGLDIGTAKPTPEERKKIPHHLIDLIEPPESFSAPLFAKKADAALQEISSRGKRSLLVGGTGLYIRVFLEGIFEGPARNEEYRKKLELLKKEKGNGFLHQELKRVDPKAAEKIHPNDPQRIVRALEVFHLTGKPISEWWEASRGATRRAPTLKIGLTLEREELYRRINERVLKMINAGWIGEVEGIIQKWGSNIPPLKLVGYREIAEYLKGKRGKEETISRIQQKTRNYAKRQLTWFRADKEIRWMNLSEITEGFIRNSFLTR
ncbi:MAG: tRNA (adenosine(37)-N6)-dimethylallyltransferase MiaA [Deltaproteobacteria bacterium]|nr:tRNA (adenosine(37)-N6)-dimethylallyltransferase MiaA [Deltaproteobacteria bacterium]